MKKLKWNNWVLLVCAGVLVGCATRPEGFDRGEAGSFEIPTAERYRLRARRYRVDVPKSYDEARPLPLVVALHGAFSDAEQLRERSGISALGEEKGFVTVYPNGIDLFGYLRHWNAGYCCAKAQRIDIDDCGFVLSIIDEVQQVLNIDPDRIYLTGFSNGGMLAQQLAAQYPERFAAVAIISSTIGMRVPGKTDWAELGVAAGPVPILLLHGKKDPRIPLEGGISTESWGPHEFRSFAEQTAYWLAANHCTAAEVQTWSPAPGVTLHAAQSATDPRGRVVYGEIDQWGHRWPGRYFSEKAPADHLLKNFDGTALVWDFFSAPGNNAAE